MNNQFSGPNAWADYLSALEQATPVIEAIINEQNALAGLYASLMARLASSSGTLNKLSFSVRRIADVQA